MQSMDFEGFSIEKVVFNADCDRTIALEFFRILFCRVNLSFLYN